MKPPIKLESPLAKKDDEALRLPITLRVDPMEDEAEEINPPYKLESPVAKKVE